MRKEVEIKAVIKLKSDAIPTYCKARPVLFSLKHKIEELDQLLQNGIIDKDEFSDWAALAVPVVKQNGSI